MLEMANAEELALLGETRRALELVARHVRPAAPSLISEGGTDGYDDARRV